MDVDGPFHHRVSSTAANGSADGDTASRSDPAGQAIRRRYSANAGASSSRGHAMALQTRRPPTAAPEPRSFEDEAPAPPRLFREPPPLAPYVTEDRRVHAPRVQAWGTGPDPGLQRHHSNPNPFIPAPIHRPPRNTIGKRNVHRETIHGPRHYHDYPQPAHHLPGALRAGDPSPSHPQRIIHPPPMPQQAEYASRETLPPLRSAIPSASTPMRKSYSNTSTRSAGYARPYSRPGSQAGSSASRPSSHDSSGGNNSALMDGYDNEDASVGHSRGTGKRRTRALMTKIQQQQLKQLWKETKFPGNAQREELGAKIGLTTRQVQVWFQNQRQKARKELNDTGMPAGADPRDWDDLDKSPRSRRLSLEAAEAANKIAAWNEVRAYGRDDGLAATSVPTSASSHFSGSGIRRFDLPQHHHSAPSASQYPHVQRPPRLEPLSLPRHAGRRLSAANSPASSFAMSPPPLPTPSPTRQTFSAHEYQRPPPPVLLHPSSRTDPYRSPINMQFGNAVTGPDLDARTVPMRNAVSIDGVLPTGSPRRRSTSLEGMRNRQTPSPEQQHAKRSRTNTFTSELPPTLAALAIRPPADDGPKVRLPSFGELQGTLPPPRGWPNERINGHYRSHTDSTSVSLVGQAHAQSANHASSRLPGYQSLLHSSNPGDRAR